jgi:hypothetical protein
MSDHWFDFDTITKMHPTKNKLIIIFLCQYYIVSIYYLDIDFFKHTINFH